MLMSLLEKDQVDIFGLGEVSISRLWTLQVLFNANKVKSLTSPFTLPLPPNAKCNYVYKGYTLFDALCTTLLGWIRELCAHPSI